MITYIIKSLNTDVYENIALEFSMFKEAEKNFKESKTQCAILFLWTNDKTIVIGRNQNVFRECNLDYCSENGINISRRFTGGGAVYHDKGNLNYTFIGTSDIYDVKQNYKIIKKALNNLGIDCELSGRNDLTSQGRKFSGSAFYNSKYASMHHGTLLIKSSSEDISKALTPDIKKLKSKGVDSVRSRIINLSEINSEINSKKLSKEIISVFEKEYNSENIEYLPQFSHTDFEKNIKLLKSTEWIFNQKLESSIELENRFEWGSIEIEMNIEGQTIRDIEIYSDTLFYDIPIKIKKSLLNQNLDKKNIDTIFKKLLNTTTKAQKNKIYTDIWSLIMKIVY